jgi:hypothetical protein
VWKTLTIRRQELLDLDTRTQVEEALLADAALDWALMAVLLGRPASDVRSGLVEAGHALLGVGTLRGTSAALPVVQVDDDGIYAASSAVDDSLDSPERARTAYHLAALTGDHELEARAAWPGGPAAEEQALAALEAADPDGFLAALDWVLARHAEPSPDPRVLISVPALGLAARAVAQRLVTPDRLPANAALPRGLLTPDGDQRSSIST